MSVLILKNTSSEGPGTIGEYLHNENIPFRVVELETGEIPPPLDQFRTLVVLGGPMGVYEMNSYPHLLSGSRIIREAMNREMKVLGICLGCQLLAYCLGARVFPGPEQEIGWRHIELSGEGLKDSLMRKLAVHPRVGDFWRRFKVFHWHGDTFDLPPGAVLLAGSQLYPHQAFRFGESIYGFQFHIEVTPEMVGEWLQDIPGGSGLGEETEQIFEEYTGRAINFYRSFFTRTTKGSKGG
jgi:GMP synthase (glutamine-hydrolysing)